MARSISAMGMYSRINSRVSRTLIDHAFLSVFIVALAVRIAAVIVFGQVFGDRFVLDDTTYSNMAKDVASGNLANWDPYTYGLFNRTLTFVVPLALIYRFLGPNELWGQLFVALSGAITALLTSRLIAEFMPKRWAVVGGLILGFFPSQVLWSSVLLKDPLVWATAAGLAVVIARTNGASGRRFVLGIALTAILLALLAHLREHSFVIACWGVAISAWAGSTEFRRYRVVASTTLAIAIPWLLGFGPIGIDYAMNQDSLAVRRGQNARYANTGFVDVIAPDHVDVSYSSLPEQIDRGEVLLDESTLTPDEKLALAYKILHTGDATISEIKDILLLSPQLETRLRALEVSGFNSPRQIARINALAEQALRKLEEAEHTGTTEEEAAAEGVGGDLAHLPLGLFVMLLEPVPWNSGGSLPLRLARWEMLLWYPLLFFAIVGLFLSRHHLKQLAFPLLIGGGVLLVSALAEGNIGTAYRHRGEFVWVVVTLACLGMASATERFGGRVRRQDGPAVHRDETNATSPPVPDRVSAKPSARSA